MIWYLSIGYDAETNFQAHKENGVVNEAGSDPQRPPPPPPKPTHPPEEHDGDGGSDNGAIIGIVIGVIAVVAVSGVVGAMVYRRLRRTRGSNDASPTKATNSPIYTKVGYAILNILTYVMFFALELYTSY